MEKSLASSARHVMPPALLARLEAEFSRPSWAERLARLLPAPRFSVPVGAAAALAVAVSLWMAYPDQNQIPVEVLLAAHARYSSEGLVSQANLTQPEFAAHLASVHAD